MKRTSIVSAMLVMMMLVSLITPASWGTVPTAAATAAAKTYLHLNFDTYPTEPSISAPTAVVGGYWSFFQTVAGTDYAIGEDIQGKTGRSFTMISNTATNLNISKSKLTIPGAGASPVIVLEGMFKFGDTEHVRDLFTTNLTNTNPFVDKNLNLKLDDKGKMNLIYPPANGGSDVTLEVGTYEAATWYHIQLYLDTSTYKLQLYINGEHRLADIELLNTWNNLKSFKFTQFGKTEIPDGRMTLDDIKVYNYIPVEAISLDKSAAEVVVGSTVSLAAAIAPSDATNPYIVWSTDNPQIAEVDQAGRVTGIAPGTATIIARSKESASIQAISTITVTTSAVHVESVEVSPAAVQLPVQGTVTLNVYVNPAHATNPNVLWSTSNDSIATVHNGVVTAIAEGEAVITATSEDGGHADHSVITVTPFILPVQGIELIPEAKVEVGDIIRMTPRLQPADATNQAVTWSSSNEAVAVVDQSGTITGVRSGTAEITVVSEDGAKAASSTVEVVVPAAPAQDEYDRLRVKWKSILDGGPSLDLSNPEINQKVQDIHATAKSHWDKMLLNDDRTTLWPDLKPSTTDSSYFNHYLVRLRSMALAYSTKGGELYHNVTMKKDILHAFNWVNQHAYNDNVTVYGNWWNFEIGAPSRAMDIMVLLYEDLKPELILAYVRAADKFIGSITEPAFRHVGANRSDIMTIEMLMGILTKDAARLSDTRDQISPLFDYVTAEDGFYQDGSFIQHKNVPYTGSYGDVLIRGVGNLLYMLNDSSWTVTDPDVRNVYRWIYESFAPVIYRGETMDMIRGRAIAREKLDGHKASVGIIAGITRIAMAAPQEDALNFKRMIKHWISSDPTINVYSEISNIDLIEPIKAIMGDAAIIPQGDSPAHYEFGAMNRTVHRDSDFAFGISKSSKRIQTYELTNGENGEGWYTGDGMTYLYNTDATQYTDDYWPTVNRYRLPGTTVDTRPRKNDHYQYGDGETTPGNAWAGGVTLGHDGVSGMNLQQVGTTLTANKSWFMFGNVIVALGTGITSQDQRTIETIVEQRKLNSAGNNALIVNGETKSSELGWKETLNGVSWMHLTGNVPGADIGYYFPNAATLKGVREARSGSWYDINRNASTSTDARVRNYVSFWYDHGSNPVNAEYSYVILPNRTSEEVSQFAQQPSIAIVKSSNAAHAVKDYSGNQVGINFWNDQVTTVAGITSNRKASVMMKETADQWLELAVSDPAMSNTGAIEIEIDRSAASVLEADPQVFVTQLYPTIKFKVSVGGSFSQSYKVKFDIDPNKERPGAERTIPMPLNEKEPVSSVTPVAHFVSRLDNELSGNQPAGWKVLHDVNTIATVEALNGTSDKWLRLLDENTEGSTTASRAFPVQTGIVKASWKFVEPEGQKGSRFRLTDGNTNAVELVTKANGLYRVDGQGNEHLVIATKAATWYTMDLTVDIPNQRYDIHVDGMLTAVGAPFAKPVSQLDSIQFSTGYEEAHATLYLDDIIVYVTGAIPLVMDDIENNEVNVKPANWSVTEDLQKNSPVYVIYEEEELNKSVLLDDDSSTFSAVIKNSFPAQAGRLIAEWRYKELSGGKFPDFSLMQGQTKGIRLTSSANNYIRYYGPGASSATNILNAKTVAKSWLHVKLDIDIPNQRYDLYFNGKLAESGIPFHQSLNTIDTIQFSSGYGAADAPLYIDDVKVYTFDVTSPQWPAGSEITVSNITSKALTLTWPSASDESGVSEYQIYVDGKLLDSVSKHVLTYNIHNLTPNTSYQFTIKALDVLGNVSAEPLKATKETASPPPGNSEPDPDPKQEPPAGSLNGTTTSVIVQAEELAKLVQQASGSKSKPVVVIPIDEFKDGAKVQLAMNEALAQVPDLVLSLQADKLGYELPVKALNLEKIAKELKVPLSDVKVEVTMEKVSGALIEQVAQKVSGSSGKLVSDVFDFNIKAEANGQALRIDDFDGTYVTRTIALNSSVPMESLTAVRIDPVSGEMVFVPARFQVINGKKTASMYRTGNSLYAVVEWKKTFADTTDHWASTEINELASKLLLQGMTDSNYEPESMVTRAQFTALLTRALGLSNHSAYASFTDTAQTDWYAGAIGAAVQAGLVQGYEDGTFRPNALVTREEMAVLTAKALQYAGKQTNAEAAKLLTSFSDHAELRSWAAEAIADMVEAGVIHGLPGNRLAPQSLLTRAQAAVIIKRLLVAANFM